MLNIFNPLTSLQKSLVVAILSVVLFVTSAGVSFSVFSPKSFSTQGDLTTSLPGVTTDDGEDPKEPKTEACPLNGQMFTKKTKELWELKWPLAVMIENHEESRPQSGLSSANVVYEAVAEGGITRFMALYLCNPSDVQVGPVRSARTYFLDWLSEYNAFYAHVGGANCNKETGSGCANGAPADALGQIIKYKIKDLNQMYYCCGYPTFWRDYTRLGRPVATEHTMYSSIEKLWKKGTDMWLASTKLTYTDWQKNFTQWKFKDEGSLGSKLGQVISTKAISSNNIKVEFWQGYSNYNVIWDYDKDCNCYKRQNGGASHIDLNNNQQLSVKNLVIQFQRESRANDGYEGNAHLLYKTLGEGRALFFQDGKAVEGKWIKPTRTARTKYIDSDGRELVFNRGMIWIQTVPEGSTVSY